MKSGITRFFLFIIVISFFNLNTYATELDPRNFDYTKVDSVALAIGKYQFNSVESLSAYINKKFTTDHERLRAIFIWITNNIEYSYSHLHSDVEAVFRTKKAVCNGYSILLKQLCDNSGIKCRVITGWAKDSFNSIDTTMQDYGHAWNIVNLYNEDYLIDATWSAGGYDREKKKFIKEFKNEFYLSKPDFFILRHFPDNPRDQLITNEVSFSEFIGNPLFEVGELNNSFSTLSNDLSNIIPDNPIIKTRYRFGNEFSFTTEQEINTIQIRINYPNSSLIHTYVVEFEKENNRYSFIWPFEYYGNFFATILLNDKESIVYNVIIE